MLECRLIRCSVLILVMAGVGGCTTSTQKPDVSMPVTAIQHFTDLQIQDLAGVWEYQQANVVYPLTFDNKGNGVYEWKHGRFVTSSLENGIWKGTWHQQDNDREGGFEMRLAQDLQTAAGRWWYTRIGEDHDPLNPGGTFTLTRMPGGVTENE